MTKFILQPYNSKQLAAFYNTTPHTLRVWIKPIKDKLGKQMARCWTTNQVKIIIEHIGEITEN